MTVRLILVARVDAAVPEMTDVRSAPSSTFYRISLWSGVHRETGCLGKMPGPPHADAGSLRRASWLIPLKPQDSGSSS